MNLWRKFKERKHFKINDTQGEVVFILGLMGVVKGINLMTDPLNPTPKSLRYVWDHYFTIFDNNVFWGVCWLIVGLTCFWYSFQFDDRPALVVLGAILGGWSFAYLIDWIIGKFSHAFDPVNLSTFFLYFALLILVVRWHGRRSG